MLLFTCLNLLELLLINRHVSFRPKKKLFGSCNPPDPLKMSRLLTFYWLGAPNIYMLVSFNRAIKYEINLFR